MSSRTHRSRHGQVEVFHLVTKSRKGRTRLTTLKCHLLVTHDRVREIRDTKCMGFPPSKPDDINLSAAGSAGYVDSAGHGSWVLSGPLQVRRREREGDLLRCFPSIALRARQTPAKALLQQEFSTSPYQSVIISTLQVLQVLWVLLIPRVMSACLR